LNVSLVCVLSIPALSHAQGENRHPGDRLLVRFHPVASAEDAKQALELMMKLFESERVSISAGTTLADLSRGRCGHVDNNWISAVLRENSGLAGGTVESTKILSLPPCPYWRKERDVQIPPDGTIGHQLLFHMGTLGKRTLAKVASANDREVESLGNVKAGDLVTLPYSTAYRAYTLKPEYSGNRSAATGLLAESPGFEDDTGERDMTLIVAASASECVAPTDTTDWPFSTEKLRKVLTYNDTRRSRDLIRAVIAVVDTGVSANEDRLFFKINDREIPDNNIDDDENGYIDDFKGANMDTRVTGFPALNEGFHDSEHGTHVSGLVLGGLGDSELNQLVKERIQVEEINMVRKDVRAGPSGPITTFSMPNDYLLDAFQYTSQEAVAQIINLSVEDEEKTGLEAALAATSALVVAAAGNDDGMNIDEDERYPAAARSRDRLITVAAYDGSGGLAKFSNWGHSNVDLAAPGCQIDSILPGGKRGKLNGTSQAAPLVAFTAGLLYAEGLTIPQIKDRILVTTDYDHAKLGTCGGAEGHCVASEGRLDIVRALNIYQDQVVIRTTDGHQELHTGRINGCIAADGRCYALRTQLKRLIHDTVSGESSVWIKSGGNKTNKRSTQLDLTKSIDFQEAGSQQNAPIPMSEVVELVPSVY
jgi:hypothetical protein